MDEFKAAVTKLIGDGEQVYFTDYKGNFAYYNKYDRPETFGSNDGIYVSERYSYYNPSDNKLYNANSTSKCKITKCFCKSTPLVLRNSIFFLVSH